MNGKMPIGFGQRVRLEWLERTAGLLLLGNGRKQVQQLLGESLGGELSATAERGALSKAVTILLKVWVTVPPSLVGLRDDALVHFGRLPAADHLLFHWGLTAAAYPFVSAVAEVAGRLLRLQGVLTAAQVQRRIREQFGERETVARATRRVMRCFVDWGVLQETSEKGTYQAAPRRVIRDEALAVWAVEAALRASGSSGGSLHGILQGPALFPFELPTVHTRSLLAHGRLEFFRQDLDEDMVTLRHQRTAG